VSLVPLWLHLLGMAVWVGGLSYQTHVLLPGARRGGRDLTGFLEAARRGRPATWVSIALVVLTGFENVTRLGPPQHVMASGAGVILAGKFILVIVAIALAGQRDFAQLARLGRTVEAGEDSARVLRAIAWLDRLVLLLMVVILYMGLAVSRAV
jgi:uncharacterized membrane protein